MRHWKLFYPMHIKHHEWTNPIAIIAEYNSPGEYVFDSIVYLIGEIK